MIAYDLSTIFIHIPKTGGTTLGNLIHPHEKIINSNNSYKDYVESNGAQHHAEHLTYTEYKNILINQNLNISNYFIVSFVRNPYSRLVSLWKYWSKKNKNHTNLLPKNNKLLNFLKSSGKSIEEFESFVYHLHSQKNKIILFGNLQNNFVKPDQVNFLGRFERMEQDIKILLKLISTRTNIDITKTDIPHLNRTSNSNTEYLNFISSTTTRDQIYEIYQSDFTIFDYEY